MKLWNPRYGTINGFTNVNQNGYLGISNQPLFFQGFFNTAGPFSRLHLADSCNNNQNDYAQVFGWRPWMKNGVSMTGNKDQCHAARTRHLHVCERRVPSNWHGGPYCPSTPLSGGAA